MGLFEVIFAGTTRSCITIFSCADPEGGGVKGQDPGVGGGGGGEVL